MMYENRYDESSSGFEDPLEIQEEEGDFYPDWLDPGGQEELCRAVKLVLRTWLRETMIRPSGLCEWMIEKTWRET